MNIVNDAKETDSSFIGIDYGARKAGTTAICWEENGRLSVEQSEKNRDADGFILRRVQQFCPETVYVDAPLSLPMVYRRAGEDYFYRESDKLLGAMSPMFLGGLTARAMKLKSTLEQIDIKVFEIYPARLVKELAIDTYYKKDLKAFAEEVEKKMEIVCPELHSWHQADAVLAWCSGLRHHKGANASYGRQEEGIIIV